MSHQPRSDQTTCLVGLLREFQPASRPTQVEVPSRLECAQSDVSKVEPGVWSLDILELRRWTAALGMGLDAFVAELERRLSAMEKIPAHWSQASRGTLPKRSRR